MSIKMKLFSSANERVIAIRKDKSLSQQEFADRLGVSRGYVGDIERGRCEPSMKFLTSLSTVFNASIDWVTDENGTMYRNGIEKSEQTDPDLELIAHLFRKLGEKSKRDVLSFAEDKMKLEEFNELKSRVDSLFTNNKLTADCQ